MCLCLWLWLWLKRHVEWLWTSQFCQLPKEHTPQWELEQLVCQQLVVFMKVMRSSKIHTIASSQAVDMILFVGEPARWDLSCTWRLGKGWSGRSPGSNFQIFVWQKAAVNLTRSNWTNSMDKPSTQPQWHDETVDWAPDWNILGWCLFPHWRPSKWLVSCMHLIHTWKGSNDWWKGLWVSLDSLTHSMTFVRMVALFKPFAFCWTVVIQQTDGINYLQSQEWTPCNQLGRWAIRRWWWREWSIGWGGKSEMDCHACKWLWIKICMLSQVHKRKNKHGANLPHTAYFCAKSCNQMTKATWGMGIVMLQMGHNVVLQCGTMPKGCALFSPSTTNSSPEICVAEFLDPLQRQETLGAKSHYFLVFSVSQLLCQSCEEHGSFKDWRCCWARGQICGHWSSLGSMTSFFVVQWSNCLTAIAWWCLFLHLWCFKVSSIALTSLTVSIDCLIDVSVTSLQSQVSRVVKGIMSRYGLET